MTIKSAIELRGEPAEGGIDIRVAPGGDEICFLATRAAFDMLTQITAGLLEEEDCKFSIEAVVAGQAYFKRGATIGLYLHRQPCVSGVSIFPVQRGLGWLCFIDAAECVPEPDCNYDPSFIAIEGTSEALNYLERLFAQMMESNEVFLSVDEVSLVFGSMSGFRLHLIQDMRRQTKS